MPSPLLTSDGAWNTISLYARHCNHAYFMHFRKWQICAFWTTLCLWSCIWVCPMSHLNAKLIVFQLWKQNYVSIPWTKIHKHFGHYSFLWRLFVFRCTCISVKPSVEADYRSLLASYERDTYRNGWVLIDTDLNKQTLL